MKKIIIDDTYFFTLLNQAIKAYPDLVIGWIRDTQKLLTDEIKIRREIKGYISYQKRHNSYYDNNECFLLGECYSDAKGYGSKGIYEITNWKSVRKKCDTNFTEFSKKLLEENPSELEKIKKDLSFFHPHIKTEKQTRQYVDYIFKYDGIISLDYDFMKVFDYRKTDFYYDNLVSYVEYCLENKEQFETIANNMIKISNLGIKSFEIDPYMDLDGNYDIDFYYKKRANKSAGYRTSYSFTDGEIKPNIDGDKYSYEVSYANFRMDIVAEPAIKKDFDLANNIGFFEKTIPYKCKNVTLNNFVVNHLTFDTDSLPDAISIQDTLYRLFPELENRFKVNKAIYECEQNTKAVNKIYEETKEIINSSLKVEGSQKRDLEKKYLELSDALLKTMNLIQNSNNELLDNQEQALSLVKIGDHHGYRKLF